MKDNISVLISGDFCPIGRNEKTIANRHFSSMFGGFERYSQSVDLAITNLECPLTDTDTAIAKTGPNLKAPYKSMEALRYAGFDLVTLANNHIMDYGEEGVKSTLQACEKYGIAYVGVGSNLAEARKFYTKIIQGKTIAIINIAENEFCTTRGDEYGANPLNVITNHYDIKEARRQVDYVIVIAHGGREHYQLPSPQQRERFRFFIESGADIVVAHHTHCFSGYEIYKGKPIFYSLGNFIFDYKKKYQRGLWTQGYAVLFKIQNNGIDFELIPYHQGRDENPNLELFTEKEKEMFDRKIEELNTIIADDTLITLAWDRYIKSQKVVYKGLLFDQNKYIRALKAKGLLPGIFIHSKEHELVLLNLLKCEAHREIMIDVLSDK